MRLLSDRANGDATDAAETAVLRATAQRLFGERGFLLANKGDAARGKANRFTDELLVYGAVAHSILSGEPVILLTKDEDLVEQTYKLTWLLDTHYRSMLFADAYIRNFGSFTVRPFPDLTGSLSEIFDSGNNVLVRKPKGIETDILPRHFDFVPFSCWVVGEYFSKFSFGAERQLERLLRVKGETGGLNTSGLGERNCHFWLAPCELPSDLRDCAAVVHDRRVSFGVTGVDIAMLDAHQSLFTGEQFLRL
jgi:hypothetical protein